MFHIGQLVVCIDNAPATHHYGPDSVAGLEKGRIYTIREYHPNYPFTNAPGEAGVKLEEITRTYSRHVDAYYGVRRFRPVKQTSIDCFTAILTKTPELVDQ